MSNCVWRQINILVVINYVWNIPVYISALIFSISFCSSLLFSIFSLFSSPPHSPSQPQTSCFSYFIPILPFFPLYQFLGHEQCFIKNMIQTRFEVQFPAEAKGFFLYPLGPTQPLVQLVAGVISPGLKRGQGVTLTIQPHQVLRSRMSRSYTFFPLKALWHVVGQL
jgi:hypothetical protein